MTVPVHVILHVCMLHCMYVCDSACIYVIPRVILHVGK